MKDKLEESYSKISDVHKYLAKIGFKVAERTLYKHKDERKLKFSSEGTITQTAVDDYAEKWLAKKGVESLANQKIQAELDFKAARTERERLQIGELEGRLISRDTVGYEFAGRIEELKMGFEELTSSLPILIANKDENSIRKIMREKFNFLLERYSRKLEALRK